jgi:hypothetical protein
MNTLWELLESVESGYPTLNKLLNLVLRFCERILSSEPHIHQAREFFVYVRWAYAQLECEAHVGVVVMELLHN